MDIAMRRKEEGEWRKAAREAARCRLCSCEGADDRCFVKVHGQDQPSCRACWEQVLLDPRRMIASVLRALI